MAIRQGARVKILELEPALSWVLLLLKGILGLCFALALNLVR